jgi:hypothetical protein
MHSDSRSCALPSPWCPITSSASAAARSAASSCTAAAAGGCGALARQAWCFSARADSCCRQRGVWQARASITPSSQLHKPAETDNSRACRCTYAMVSELAWAVCSCYVCAQVSSSSELFMLLLQLVQGGRETQQLLPCRASACCALCLGCKRAAWQPWCVTNAALSLPPFNFDTHPLCMQLHLLLLPSCCQGGPSAQPVLLSHAQASHARGCAHPHS